MNLIQNPTFRDNGEGWVFHASGGGVFVAGNGAAILTVNAPGNNVQFYQPGVAGLKPQTRYRVSVRVQSNDGSDVALYLHRHGAPYDTYGLGHVVELLPREPREVAVEFVTPDKDVTNGRFRLWLAPFAQAGTIYTISDPSLVELTEEPTEPEPPPPPPPPPPPVDLSHQVVEVRRDWQAGDTYELRIIGMNGEDYGSFTYTYR